MTEGYIKYSLVTELHWSGHGRDTLHETGHTLLGTVVQLVEYWTRNQEVPSLTHTRSTASNLEQVANLLCAQANSASHPQQDEKWVLSSSYGYGVKA